MNGNDIILTEYAPTTATLSDHELTILRRDYSAYLDVAPSPEPGQYILQPRQYVGLIALSAKRTLEIRPKVTIGVLFAMLAKAYHLAEYDNYLQGYTSVAALFEFVTGQFVTMVDQLIRRGPMQSFRTSEQETQAIRGKILLTETLRRNPVIRTYHQCEITDLSADVPENRRLKYACEQLARMCRGSLAGQLARLARSFGDVHAIPDEPIIYHRLNTHYRPALTLADMLLAHLSPGGTHGARSYPTFPAFLVDMNRLFEQYITTIVREAIPDLRIVPQGSHALDRDRQVIVRPDVVIYRADQPLLALDAKYKRDAPNTDIYQALSYCHAFGLSRAILVYPGDAHILLKRYQIRPTQDGTPVEILLLPLDLSGGPAEMQHQADCFAEVVKTEIRCQ